MRCVNSDQVTENQEVAEMTMPQFTAEASLAPASGQYRVHRGVDSSGKLGISPMQQVTSASLFSGIHSWKPVSCCVDYFGNQCARITGCRLGSRACPSRSM